jgi:hypothetical protein
MRGRFDQEAPAQAAAMLAAVELLHPGALDRLRRDPAAELATWDDVCLREVDENGTMRCSVAGGYLDETEPPTLLVARSTSYRRRGFTSLHELGHHLQRTDLGLGQNLYTREDSEKFEEFACDAFAARVLLPDDNVAEYFPERGPTAPGVVEMFHASRASREACCVRAAAHVTGAGVVALLDTTGEVVFAAPRGMFPPARGSNQAHTPLIAAALRTSETVERDETFVSYRGGSKSDLCYGQAAWCDGDYLVAILATDNAAWRPLALPRPDTGQGRMGRSRICETCETAFQAWDPPCEICSQPRCPDGHCGCDAARAAKDRQCDQCYLVLAQSRFEGNSRSCRDCA